MGDRVAFGGLLFPHPSSISSSDSVTAISRGQGCGTRTSHGEVGPRLQMVVYQTSSAAGLADDAQSSRLGWGLYCADTS